MWLLPAISLYFFLTTSTFSLFAGEIKIIDAESLKQTLSNSRNKITIVDFWATWCTPCKKQLPALSRIFTKYRGNGLSVIGVSMDFDKDKAKRFIGKLGIKYPVYLAAEDMAFNFDIQALPATFIYGKGGNLIKSHTGFINEDELIHIIEKMLNINNLVGSGHKATP